MTHPRDLPNTLLLTLALLAAASPAGASDAEDHAEAFRELRVFEGILQNFLSGQGQGQGARVTGHYLAGQGFVFRVEHRVDTGGLDRILAWSSDLAEAIEGGVLELLAEHPRVIEQMPEDFAPELLGADQEGFEALRTHARALRALEQEQRDVAGELAELEDRVSKEGAASRRLRELEARQDALVEHIEARRRELAATRQTIRARQTEAREAARARAQAALQGVEARLVDGLCRFGGSLRALSADERIAIIVRVHQDDPAGEPRPDRVLTFPVPALNDCGARRMDAEGLLARAQVYDHPGPRRR